MICNTILVLSYKLIWSIQNIMLSNPGQIQARSNRIYNSLSAVIAPWYILICIHIHVYTHTRTYTHILTYLRTYLHTYLYIHTYTHAPTYIPTHSHTLIYLYTYLRAHTCTYTRIFTCESLCIRMHGTKYVYTK